MSAAGTTLAVPSGMRLQIAAVGLAFGLLGSSTTLAAPTSASTVIRDPAPVPEKTWAIEVALGAGSNRSSDYTRRLEDFGYVDARDRRFRVSIAAEKQLTSFLSILFQANRVNARRFDRSSGIGPDDEFSWTTWAYGVHGRVFVRARDRKYRAYLQVGGGPTLTRSKLLTRVQDNSPRSSFVERDIGYHLMGLAGIDIRIGSIVGFLFQGGYVYARGFKNLLGDEYVADGIIGFMGLRFRLGRGK